MAKKNYGQYYKKAKNEEEGMPVIETPEVKMEVERSETSAMPVIETEYVPAVDVIIEPKPVTGTVTGCSKLNVRTEPETIADILCILDAGSEMKIDMAKSTKDWFKVTTASGVDGYCMRKFVKI